MVQVKRQIKDSVYRLLFGNAQDKRYLLQLYQTLHPEDTETTVEDLKIVTVEDVIVNDIYNDLGFMVGDRMIILAEAQSTWSVNIVSRIFLYLAKEYRDIVYTDEENKRKIYQNEVVRLPVPELYVIYTGDDPDVPEQISLQQTVFGRAADIEVIVHVRRIQPDAHDIINQYITFCRVFDEQRRLHGKDRKAAVKQAIDICKDRDVLTEFLITHEKEVDEVMMCLFSQDEWNKVIDEELRAEGRAEGMVRAYFNLHWPPEKIASESHLPIAEVKRIISEIKVEEGRQ